MPEHEDERNLKQENICLKNEAFSWIKNEALNPDFELEENDAFEDDGLINKEPLEIDLNLIQSEPMTTTKLIRKCKPCNLEFSSKLTLAKHNQFVHKKAPFKCSECPKTYNSKDTLKRHFKTAH